ncbi:hypothetical protein KIN20_020982 [Parelaphostrongylus tenuis]|uniref:Uncharacterized protein n=1 Tax=Parelaphostrongylus tenuis TaxID=148309 RepID=A0AAD5MYB2_PARTN|nr:hypothetical protein KIN20_013962 [Parelaphostrongylus tenuis]KAJ1361670.1 hypothetical protein KIN20_020975 [Parelaphostrongylus tenuis]KAJ1361676.1 hypothetical protein KIN20_020982 [Parelaphostrongylus tenuis]
MTYEEIRILLVQARYPSFHKLIRNIHHSCRRRGVADGLLRTRWMSAEALNPK